MIARPMSMPEATVELIRELGARGAPEIELYEQLGFPDGFGVNDTAVQTLVFHGEEDSQVTLHGGQVKGHPHHPAPFVEWDGVVRPKSLRELQRHIQRLSPEIRPGSPLGAALLEIEQGTDTPGGAPWRRAVHWWALSQSSPREDLAERLGRWLTMLGDDEELRIAAELVRPGFAREVLVASHCWPPSERAISLETVHAAIPADWPDRYHVVCLSVDDPSAADDLGTVTSVRGWSALLGLLAEIATFAEPDRATSFTLGWNAKEEAYALTGDGKVWRRARDAWLLAGDASTVLVATLEPVVQRLPEL